MLTIVIYKIWDKSIECVSKYYSPIYQAAEASFSTNCKMSFLSTAL